MRTLAERTPASKPQPPVRENGYYLNTGDLQQAPEQDWSGGNASTGTVSGTWLSVASDFISYESDMDGLLLKNIMRTICQSR